MLILLMHLKHFAVVGGFSVFAGVGERTREGNDLYREMIESVSNMHACMSDYFLALNALSATGRFCRFAQGFMLHVICCCHSRITGFFQCFST